METGSTVTKGDRCPSLLLKHNNDGRRRMKTGSTVTKGDCCPSLLLKHNKDGRRRTIEAGGRSFDVNDSIPWLLLLLLFLFQKGYKFSGGTG
jgi:hypothetical protein